MTNNELPAGWELVEPEQTPDGVWHGEVRHGVIRRYSMTNIDRETAIRLAVDAAWTEEENCGRGRE